MSVTSEVHQITSPGEFAASLPRLMGFTPEESLIVVFLHEASVVVSMRLGLEHVAPLLTEKVVSTAERAGANRVILAVVSDSSDCWFPFHDTVSGLVAALTDAELEVIDALHVRAGRIRSYVCDCASCSLEHGIQIPETVDVRETGVTRELVERREDVVQHYAPRPEEGPGEDLLADAATLEVAELKARALHAWMCLTTLADDSSLRVPGSAGDRLRAEFLTLVQHVHVRDYVITRIASDDDAQRTWVDVVVEAALRAPVGLRARAAGMAAALLAAFEASSIPADCLVALSDGDSLGELVQRAVQSAFPPHAIRQMLADCTPLVLAKLTEEPAGT